MLKDYLKEKRVDFSEKHIDEDDAARTEMMEVSNGFLEVPFVSIIKDDGTKETVIGFDRGKLDTIFK